MKFCFILTLLLLEQVVFAQCSGGSNGGAITPTTSWQTLTVAAGNYYTFTVPAGACDTYDFTFCQGGGTASYDTQISIRTNADVYANGYNDDNCGLSSQILSYTPSAGAGTYRVLINNYFCASSGATATLAYKKNSPGTNADYQFLSNATASGSCINLTAASNNQTGCSWDVNSTLNFASNFSYDFTINLGSSDAGADGMAFVMQNDPSGRCKCGTAGGSLGAGGITNSLTVEVDTYLNTEDRDDGMTGVLCSGGPEPDHLDIWLNGVVNPEYGSSCVTDGGERVVASAVRLMSGANIYNIENGANHVLRIAWNAGTTTLTASVWDSGVTTMYGTISYSFNPITVFGTNTPYFGFTASTGGLNNLQTFCLPSILLPVEIVSFNALCESNRVKIEWTSISENQNAYYQLDRSFDGITYESFAVITGEMSSNQLKTYTVHDVDAIGKPVFYRLMQTDINGETRMVGDPLFVECEGNLETASLFPNPANELVQIQFNSSSLKEKKVNIYDISGKQLFTLVLPSETKATSIPLAELPQGVYFLIIEENQTVILNEKLVIAR